MTAWLYGRHQAGNQDFSWHDRTMIMTTVYLTSDDDNECDDDKIDESHVIAWSHDDDNDDDDTEHLFHLFIRCMPLVDL